MPDREARRRPTASKHVPHGRYGGPAAPTPWAVGRLEPFRSPQSPRSPWLLKPLGPRERLPWPGGIPQPPGWRAAVLGPGPGAGFRRAMPRRRKVGNGRRVIRLGGSRDGQSSLDPGPPSTRPPGTSPPGTSPPRTGALRTRPLRTRPLRTRPLSPGKVATRRSRTPRRGTPPRDAGRCGTQRCGTPRGDAGRRGTRRDAVWLGTGGRKRRGRQRDFRSLLGKVGDLVPGHHDLEHLPVDLPVPELPGQNGIAAQVDDVQPVAEVVEHQAGVAPVVAHRARLPQRVEIADVDLLAPVPGGGTEAEFLRRRAGGEQRHLRAVRTEAGLVRGAAVRGHQPVSHPTAPCTARPGRRTGPRTRLRRRPACTGRRRWVSGWARCRTRGSPGRRSAGSRRRPGRASRSGTARSCRGRIPNPPRRGRGRDTPRRGCGIGRPEPGRRSRPALIAARSGRG